VNYLDGIIKIAAVLGALGVIYGAALKVLQGLIKPIKDTLTDLKKHSHENYMSLLRLTIMSNEMPIGERIVAGHKYLQEGGNGEVKAFLKSKFNIEETIEDAEHYKK
jgi:hypothetical protein